MKHITSKHHRATVVSAAIGTGVLVAVIAGAVIRTVINRRLESMLRISAGESKFERKNRHDH